MKSKRGIKIGSLKLVWLIGLLLPGLLAAPMLSAVEIDYKKLYKKTSKAVVLLYGTDGQQGSKGTGTIIDKSGLVLTNTHVVVNDDQLWDKQFVFLKPDKVTGSQKNDLSRGYSAKVLVINPEFDLALVQIINPPDDLPVLPLSDLSNVGIGEPTVAIGHPGGGAAWTLTTGKISASWRSYEERNGWDIFQTETPLNPGNSGGPLIDGSGAVIGINTFIVRQGSGGMALTGLNFAVKSTTARKWIIDVVGELPPASAIKAEPQEIPPPAAVDGAGVPKQTAKAADPYISKNKTGKTRKPELAEADPKTEDYKHTEAGRAGTIFSGLKLDSLEKIKNIHRIFDDNSFNN
jgi:serine protease Do